MKTSQLPNFLEKANHPDRCWPKDTEIFRLKEDDPFNTKTNMTFGSAISMVDLLMDVQHCAQKWGIDTLILHDPQDEICLYEGSSDFKNNSLNGCVELVDCPGQLHDLTSNCFQTVSKNTVEFIQKIVNKRSKGN
mmetsp:Transcript_90275/g.195376  ORF Transcript_90275/g.195376 Transcript_90275/m.195376 type:complete len:135 (-) Transcript_90275:29-433(-)